MNTANSARLIAPPPAIPGVISGILLAALTRAAAPSAEAQTAGTLTIAATSNNDDRDPDTPGLQVHEGDRINITVTAHGKTAGAVTAIIDTTGTASATDTNPSISPRTRAYQIAIIVGQTQVTRVAATDDDNIPEPDETITFTISGSAILLAITPPAWTIGSPASVTVTILANDGYVDPVTPPVVTPGPAPGPATDNPAARADRLDAPAGAVARGIGGLAMDAVTKRARSVATTNQFHLGRANTAEELLRRSGFSLAAGDNSRGVSIWGSGGYVSADGDHEGVDYDGNTSAFHLGGDTQWRDGLIGVAVSHSSGDIDFTVTADGMKSTLETTVTSVHPYLTRRFNNSQLWTTIGYGSGDAELREPDSLIKTDITVTTAAFGINHKRGDLFTAGLSAQYNRAKLDAATTAGKSLPATTADTIRIAAEAEAGWTHGAWRPFLTFALRHDSGDGNTGGAADLGGGVEYQTPTVLVRLAGSGHIQGQAADEQRATLTVHKSTGNFALNLNLAADAAGVDTARLLHGEWRF